MPQHQYPPTSVLRMYVVLALLVAGFADHVSAQLTVPGADGSDGSLVIAAGTTTIIDLENAGVVEGNWDTAGTGSGVYDQNLHLFVLKLTSLDVQAGATLGFTFQSRSAPVMMLIEGNATIAGTIDVKGQDGTTNAAPFTTPQPGPGGYRGGPTPPTSSFSFPGHGPAGGDSSLDVRGEHAAVYGNDFLLPLTGGSGGASRAVSGGTAPRNSGGAGGGAIAVVCAGAVQLDGTIDARGGSAPGRSFGSGGGAGGSVRVVGTTINGSGSISALGGVGIFSLAADSGRIRLEVTGGAVPQGFINNCNPAPIQAIAADPVPVVPSATSPTVTLTAIGGIAVPSDPAANMTPELTDVFLASSGPTDFEITTTQLDPATTMVTVRVAPRQNGPEITAVATHVSGDVNSSSWIAPINLVDVIPHAVTVHAKQN